MIDEYHPPVPTDGQDYKENFEKREKSVCPDCGSTRLITKKEKRQNNNFEIITYCPDCGTTLS